MQNWQESNSGQSIGHTDQLRCLECRQPVSAGGDGSSRCLGGAPGSRDWAGCQPKWLEARIESRALRLDRLREGRSGSWNGVGLGVSKPVGNYQPLPAVADELRGIFRGGPHPGQRAGEKLNPLQQLTYLALLNLLFPLQIGTGVLVWAVGHWPQVAAALGGLSVIAPLHNLGAWLFLSFFTLHVYLVTTGRTLGEHLRAMATGYQLVEPEPDEPQGA